MTTGQSRVAHSQYIYPHQPFTNLADKSLREPIVDGRRIKGSDVKTLLKANSLSEFKPTGGSDFERLISVFRSPFFRLGPESYIDDHLEFWKASFERYVGNSDRLEFCIMACPFKIPCPLKTERRTADFGEALFLNRLYLVAQELSKIYAPGVRITILAEGIFGEFIGLEPAEWSEYRSSIENLVELFGFSEYLAVHNLDEIEVRCPEFRSVWNDSYHQLKRAVEAKEPSALAEFEGAYDSILRIVNTRMYSAELLMDAYNFELSDHFVTDEVREVRRDIHARTAEAVLQYRGFLKARDLTDYVEKLIPGCIKLTLSAKHRNLGVIPINQETSILPYHGVGVVHTESKRGGVNYLVDVLRYKSPLEVCFLDGDTEEKPFCYLIGE